MARIRSLLHVLLSYFPTKLPHGMTEFEEWSRSIIAMSHCPDNESTRFTVAVMILHMDAAEDRKPKRFFVKKLNKAAANQCADAVATKLKEDQKKRHEAAEALRTGAMKDVQ